jgi:hypothetical protein
MCTHAYVHADIHTHTRVSTCGWMHVETNGLIAMTSNVSIDECKIITQLLTQVDKRLKFDSDSNNNGIRKEYVSG